jgi:hypothetical protein
MGKLTLDMDALTVVTFEPAAAEAPHQRRYGRHGAQLLRRHGLQHAPDLFDQPLLSHGRAQRTARPVWSPGRL